MRRSKQKDKYETNKTSKIIKRTTLLKYTQRRTGSRKKKTGEEEIYNTKQVDVCVSVCPYIIQVPLKEVMLVYKVCVEQILF